MTEEEYNNLEEDDLVHFKGDHESAVGYNWTIMHIMSEGIMIDNTDDVPMYLEKEEVLDQLEVSKYNEIESWRILCDINEEGSWDGELDITLNRDDLKFILNGVVSAYEHGTVSKEYLFRLLHKFNIKLSDKNVQNNCNKIQ